MTTDLQERYQAGSQWRLTDNYGNEGDPGRVLRGALGRVREVVAAGIPGAHNGQEDVVVIEFEREDGGRQAIAFNQQQLSSLFDEAG